MMGTRKYLCWVLVALMFLAVLSGGCGGGSSGGSSSSDNGTTNENGTDDSSNSNGVEGTIEGTWKPLSGTYSLSAEGITFAAKMLPETATAQKFKIAVAETVPEEHEPGEIYMKEGDHTITLSGEGVTVDDDVQYVEADFEWTSGKEYLDEDGTDFKGATIIQGNKYYNLTGTNTYSWIINASGVEASYTIQLTAANTLHSIIKSADGGTMDIVFERVPE